MKLGIRTIVNPSYRQRTAHHAMLLGGMTAITTSLLIVANQQTAPDIELRRLEDVKSSLEQVIPASIHHNDLIKDTILIKGNFENKTVHLAKEKNHVVAVAFDTIVEGYAGPIVVIVGITQEGELLGTRVLSHNETPGLGDKIEAKKDPWILKFKGLSLTNPGETQWKVKKDGGYFDQFTGATITPRAVIKAIKSSLEFFQANKSQILSSPHIDDKTHNDDKTSSTG